MLNLFSTDPGQVPRLRSALPAGAEVVAVEDWSQLERALSAAECSVIHLDRLDSTSTLPRLSALRSRHPRHPVVLVTRWELENARHLKDVSVDEVIWLPEIEGALRGAVERACARCSAFDGDLRGLARVLGQAGHLPNPLREALAHACRTERPVHSVNELATAVGRNRRSLWHQWTRAVGTSSPLRLQDFLHWVLLLRALARKTPERTWVAVAHELKLSPHTLWRYAKDLTGRTLPALAGAEDEVLRRFHARVLEPLLGPGRLDNP